MKRHHFAIALGFAGLLGLCAPALAEVSVHIDIGNAPPPPRYVFVERPREVYVPEQRVYVVDDPRIGGDDCFRYGGYYWVFRSGYWYRTSRWGGRFMVVEPRYVPTAFYRMPPRRWKHGPPAHAARWSAPGHVKRASHDDRDYRDHDNDRGKGHGRGHK